MSLSAVADWPRIAAEIGASFEHAPGSPPVIRRRTGAWVLSLQMGTVGRRGVSDPERQKVATFLTVPIINTGSLELTIYREGVAEHLIKVYGAQDLETGDSEFDRRFMCKSNDDEKFRQILADERLRGLLLGAPETVLTLSWNRPNAVDRLVARLVRAFLPDRVAEMSAATQDRLQSYREGVVSDAGAIRQWFELCEAILAKLAQLDFARPAAGTGFHFD